MDKSRKFEESGANNEGVGLPKKELGKKKEDSNDGSESTEKEGEVVEGKQERIRHLRQRDVEGGSTRGWHQETEMDRRGQLGGFQRPSPGRPSECPCLSALSGSHAPTAIVEVAALRQHKKGVWVARDPLTISSPSIVHSRSTWSHLSKKEVQ